MRHDPKSYLWDIQQATQRINSLTAETTFDEYNADWRVSLLVERLFIIGAAINVISTKDEAMSVLLGNRSENWSSLIVTIDVIPPSEVSWR